MFCPGCGKQVVDSLRFCNSCGTNLHLVQQALATNSVSNFPPSSNSQPYPLNSLAPSPDPALLKRHKEQLFLKKIGVISLVLTPLWATIMGIVGNILENLSWELGHFIAGFAAFSAIFFLIGLGTLIYRRIIYKDVINLSPILNNPGLNTASLPPVPFSMQPPTMSTPALNLDHNYNAANAGRPLFSSPSRSFETPVATAPDPNAYVANTYPPANVYEQPTNQLHRPEIKQ
jgi:hypothetical protein